MSKIVVLQPDGKFKTIDKRTFRTSNHRYDVYIGPDGHEDTVRIKKKAKELEETRESSSTKER
jgi:hypothetical protein